MNKIFKIVWNKGKGAYEVVGEYAKACGKNNVKAIVLHTLVGAMLLSGNVAFAQITSDGTGNDDGMGTDTIIAGGSNNTISSSYATISGGTGNAIAGIGGTISGGIDNTTTASSRYSTIGGGEGNKTDGFHTVVSGGKSNEANSFNATVGGGEKNIANGNSSTISGGNTNTINISAGFSSIGGGNKNTITGSSATIAGGTSNTTLASYGTIGGGTNNTASGYATIAGGSSNTANTGGFVGGGSKNTAGSSWSAVGGGQSNTAADSYSAVLGGYKNTADGQYSAISGGYSNTATGTYSGVGSGRENTATGNYSFVGSGYKNSTGSMSFVGGGWGNAASGGQAAIGGGYYNTASGDVSAVAGGYQNTAGGTASSVVGGIGNQAMGAYSTALGGNNSRAYGENSLAGLGGVTGVATTDATTGVTMYSGGTNSIALGSGALVEVDEGIALGTNASVTEEGGVALGSGAVASRALGYAGYDLATGTTSTNTSIIWKSTAAAVSVGNVDNGVTRQITGVAAGTADTDAVNVAQLKQALSSTTNVTVDTQVINNDHSVTNVVVDNVDLPVVSLQKDQNETKLTIGDEANAVAAQQVVIKNVDANLTNNGKTLNVTVGNDATVSLTDTNTATNDVTTISGSTDSDGVMTITQTTRQDTMTDGVWTQGTEMTKKIEGIASTDYVDNKVNQVENNINKLGNRVDKVGAGAAALAALHPLEYDPEQKWAVSAGFGNYRSEQAGAVGLFYRPNDRVIFSLGSTVGNDDNMVNAGVTFALDKNTTGVKSSKAVMAQQIEELQNSNAQLHAEIAELRALVSQLAGSKAQ